MKTQIIFYEYGLRPHVSSVFSGFAVNFRKRSPEWKFLNPIRIRIRVDGFSRKFLNTLTSCSIVQSSTGNQNKEQSRKFPDTVGYVWTVKYDSNTLRVDAKIFVSAKKYFRKKKFPDTCGQCLSVISISFSFYFKARFYTIF